MHAWPLDYSAAFLWRLSAEAAAQHHLHVNARVKQRYQPQQPSHYANREMRPNQTCSRTYETYIACMTHIHPNPSLLALP
eukprot:3507141-Amphidinium_carterae.1